MPNSHVSRTAPEAQQESSWSAPRGTLAELLGEARRRIVELEARRPELERAAADADAIPGFRDALRGTTVAVIAEVKRRSPSKGDLDPAIMASGRAASYARGGAAAISVLTEPTRFAGSMDDLREVAGSVAIPVLRKDFILHDLQILEARAAGAAAILLIARALEPSRLPELVSAARRYGVEPLVEVRTAGELARAIDAGAAVVGVNARDLETLIVDRALSADLLPRVPAGVIAVAESDIADRAGVESAARAGADAVLVGSALSVAADPERAVRELTGVARGQR